MISVHSWIFKIYSSEFVLYSIRFEIIGCKWIFNTEISKELNLEVFHQFFISCILARHFGINYGNLCLMQRMFFRRCFNSVNFSIDECMVTVKNVWVVLNSEFVSRVEVVEFWECSVLNPQGIEPRNKPAVRTKSKWV